MRKDSTMELLRLKLICQTLILGNLGFAIGVFIGGNNRIKLSLAYETSHNRRRLSISPESEDPENIVLPPSLKKRIQLLATATSHTKSHQVPFRNMMLYGPSGTGKTMVATEFARKSGLDYCLIRGGDVAHQASQARMKMHHIFDLAKKSKKGLLIVIDDAEMFLHKRTSTYMSKDQRSAVNAFLFRTSDLSQDIALILTTNRPDDLDSAVTDRIDEAIEFTLPGEEERFKLFKLYLKKAGKEGNLSDKVINEAARKTKGLSGREIAKLVASVVVYGGKSLDSHHFEDIVDLKVEEHHKKDIFLTSD